MVLILIALSDKEDRLTSANTVLIKNWVRLSGKIGQ